MQQAAHKLVDIKQDKLDRAIAARREAASIVQSAAEAAARAGQLLAAAQDKAAKFIGLDAEIDFWRAERIKAGAENLHLAPGLQNKLTARNAARQQIEDAEAAGRLLRDELTEKETVLAEARTRVGEAAAALLIDEATRLGSDLEIAWQTMWQLVDNLHGLASVWCPQGGAAKALVLPANVVALLQLIAGFDHRQFPGGRNKALAKASTKWHAKYQELIE